jgi:putative Mg2+ transporter-C (MgtC) family protein
MDIAGQLTIFGHVLLSALLGGLVGLEREIKRKPAGIRTHMLVAATSTVLISLSTLLIEYSQTANSGAQVVADPNRIIEAIIVGISFIGAGTIIKNPHEFKVGHLITAASILFVVTIGISVAINQFFLAACLALFAVVINYGLELLEKDYRKEDPGSDS